MKQNKIALFLLRCTLSILMSINLIAATQPTKPVDIRYISTGNSDCILISDNGHHAIIDGADNDDEQFLVN